MVWRDLDVWFHHHALCMQAVTTGYFGHYLWWCSTVDLRGQAPTLIEEEGQEAKGLFSQPPALLEAIKARGLLSSFINLLGYSES